MIRIGSVNNAKREFTPEESEEMIPVWEKLTRKASERSMRSVSAYGRVDLFSQSSE